MLWFIAILLYIIICLSIFVGLVKDTIEKRKAIRADNEPVKATLIEKRRKAMATMALFETEDGNRILLEIPREVAEYMAVGDIGMLSYYKKIFRSFIRSHK